MKPFLVDVPVKIVIWTRPDCQRKQFEIIKQARPSILFIQSDGGRNDEEWKNIFDNRRMIDEGIDWDCKTFRLYEDKNNGMYTMEKKSLDLIWSIVDRCVFLEDDDIPAISYFRFCADLLEKYKDDERIQCICGFNHVGKWEKCSSDYFFSRQGAIWGMATWKKRMEEYGDFSYGKDNYIMGLLKQRTRRNPTAWARLNAYINNKTYEGHVPSSEFYSEFFMYAQNRLQIVPKYNLISNIGVGCDSEHFDTINTLPRGIRKMFYSSVYEYTFPLKHPKYVIPDVEYEKIRNKILGYNTPIIKICRKIERVYLKIRAGEINDIYKKVVDRLLCRRKKDEL